MKFKKKKLCPPSVGVYVPPVVGSARRYKCGHVQSAQEYIMYLDTDDISRIIQVRISFLSNSHT